MSLSIASSPLLFILSLSIFVLEMGKPVATATPRLVLRLLHPLSVQSRDHLGSQATADIFAPLTSPLGRLSYLVNISIGNPPVPHLLTVDTGSSLLWLQCRPCTRCFPQAASIYDPTRSSTYRIEPCRHTNGAPRLVPDVKTRTCNYTVSYVDGTESKGTLAKETLTFQTTYGDAVASLTDVVFGCAHDNYSPIPLEGSGILGLSYNPLSIVRRFSSRFSHCFGKIGDPNYTDNILVLGDDGAFILGDSTPLEIANGHYYLSIDAISIGGIMLPIEPLVFQRTDYNGGTMLDTGTSLVYLISQAYEWVRREITDLLDRKFKRRDATWTLCYEGNIERDLVGFPILTFHFEGGAQLSMDADSLFINLGDRFCLTVVESSFGLSYIGAVALQSYNVGYDLQAMRISFERIDCGVLFDY